MYWLIVTRIAMTALTPNGQVVAGPETTITSMSSLETCLQAAAIVQSRAIGQYRVFANCAEQ